LNWKEFQDGIFALTENDIKNLMKEILTTYKSAIAEINAKLEKVYLTTLSGVDPTDSGYFIKMLERNRLETLKKEITKEYLAYSQRVGQLLEHVVSISASNAYYRSIYALSWIDNSVYAPLPYNMVELITHGTAAEWKAIPAKISEKYGNLATYIAQDKTLTQMILQNRSAELDQILRAVTNGFQTGASYPQIAKTIKETILSITKQDGKTTVAGAGANAMRIARTEGARAAEAANYAAQVQAADSGLNIERVWVTAHDDRVRDSHAAMDGKRAKIGEPFSNGKMIPSDYNERCTVMTIVDGEMPTARRGRDPVTGENEVYSWRNFDQWRQEKGLTKNIYGELYEST
jgi:SPP1 gp7 family putative phage head morphogenesis protein